MGLKYTLWTNLAFFKIVFILLPKLWITLTEQINFPHLEPEKKKLRITGHCKLKRTNNSQPEAEETWIPLLRTSRFVYFHAQREVKLEQFQKPLKQHQATQNQKLTQ